MNIAEAVKKALKVNGLITRSSDKLPGADIYSAVKPTNSYATCILVVMEGGKTNGICRWWNPTADDLMADDWDVIKEEGDAIDKENV